MKRISKMTIAAAVGLLTIGITSQTSSRKPTNEEAKTTCITLRNLLEIAAGQDRAADSAALSRAYKVASQYISDPSSVEDQTKWVRKFDGANPDLATVYVPNKGGFKNHTIDDVAQLSADDEHQSAIVLLNKDNSYEVLHSTLDAHALSSFMIGHGKGVGVATGNGK